jgi:hypothetical protein
MITASSIVEVQSAVQPGASESAHELDVATNKNVLKTTDHTTQREAPATQVNHGTTKRKSDTTPATEAVLGSNSDELPSCSEVMPEGSACLPEFAKRFPVQVGIPVPTAVCPTRGIQVNPGTTQGKSSTTASAEGVFGKKLQHLPSSSNTHDSEAHVKAFPVGTSFLPDPAKRVPLQWGVPVPLAIGPTRETCPPPAAKLTPS